MRLLPLALLVGVVQPASGQVKGSALFERFKELAGEWVTPYPNGDTVTIRYELISGGTAVMERVLGPEHGGAGMLSIYHAIGDGVAVSHFCTGGTQPRFRSSGVGDTIRFQLDPASVAHPREGHIHSIEFRFLSGGALETTWVWFDQGREDHVLVRRQLRKN